MTVDTIALTDFGSTFTKLTLVEVGSGRRVASSATPTTASTDVMQGYETALAVALARTGDETCRIVDSLAASSAAGGLRVAAIGLAGDYTAAAARQAALNAGARVELVLTGRLGESGLAALDDTRPDIVLFSGGTDGGQARQVLANADALAQAPHSLHVIVACNCIVADEVAARLDASGHHPRVVANVMPEIDRLDIEPARAELRELFIDHVIAGKGLSESAEFGHAVVMPTPEAVLVATRLLAFGPGGQGGLGDVLVVDVGGATTDVHSSVTLRSPPVGVTVRGLPPLSLTRTVQGDLGMRWSAPGILDADADWLACQSGQTKGFLERSCALRHARPDYIAVDDDDVRMDRLLAVSCLAQALRRHCGCLTTVYVPGQGSRFVQEGLDLRGVPTVIGTGGILVRDNEGPRTLGMALARRDRMSLAPDDAGIIVDRSYILAAAGLLAGRDPIAAFRLMTSEPGFEPAGVPA